MQANSNKIHSIGSDALAEEELLSGKTARLVILVFALNMVSAALFIYLINRPVYDEPYNIFDVHKYATQGLSLETLLSHRNPPGPAGFLWMAAGVRLLRGEELRDARITILVSWILLAAGITIGARHSRFREYWYGALLVTMVFPHAMEATATLLTEAPSLLFAVLGALSWTEFVSRPKASNGVLVLGMIGGLSMGLAVTSRQYYLALLPAAALFALRQWRTLPIEEKTRWAGSVILSLAFAAIPILLLVFVWKGISSPGMATGTSYHHMWKATIGLNLSRPIIVAFYTGVYILPLTFAAMFRLRASQRRGALLVALLGGTGIVYCNSLFLQPGPLNSFIRFASRLPFGATTILFAIAVIVIYNAASFCILLWEQRQTFSSCDPAVFAFLVMVFFVAEQIGVGGNLPFYDRYMMQLAPFLGLLAIAALPRLTTARLLALSSLTVLSHIMLWRFAFRV
jgi:hypothetical protein